MYQVLALLALFTLLYSSVAGKIERTWISGPIIFTVFGLLVGPVGFNILPLDTNGETMRTLAELTLALVLFTDAAGADINVLRKARTLPIRLLMIGLPLTILLGIGIGVLLIDKLSLFEIALLATLLAPTDAALGKAVVTNEAVPNEVRQGLNVESGLNDGICVPILFVFLSLAVGQAAGQFTWLILLYSVLTLTVIRMLPVFISLTGTGMSTEGKLFAGWFGPRGLASIVFAIIVVNAKLPNSGPIAMTAVCTIILSILAHGISANPWAQSFGQRHS